MGNIPEIGTPVRTKAIMNEYGLNLKKSLGQNFLTDINVLKNIVAAGDVTADDDVIEIGPGIGALTEQLAKSAHQVLAFEIDQNLIPVLDETLAPYDNVKIINQDILKVDLGTVIDETFENRAHLKVVANLPYYITTPILMNLLEGKIEFERIVVMMQKEVADRLSAIPGTKAYGSLSLAVQYKMNAEIAFVVPKTVFVPQPNVDSAIVSLTKREPLAILPVSDAALFRLIKGCFNHRRKSLWNNLQAIFGKTEEIKTKMALVLESQQISPQIRAERLSLEEFISLTNALDAQELF